MKGEVNDVDFMLIEAIKIFFPEFYELIKNNPNYFISEYKNSYNGIKDSAKIDRIKSTIDDASKDYLDTDKLGIQSLLQAIFPQLIEVYNNHQKNIISKDSLDQWYNEKKICSPHYFDRYFTYSVQEGEISDVEFEKILSGLGFITIQDLGNTFKELINNTSTSAFLTKIRSREKTYSWEEAKKLSKAIALIGDKFPKNDNNPFFDFYSPLSEAAMFISNLVGKGENNELKIKLIKELIDSTNSFEFAYKIHNWLVDNNDNREAVSKEEGRDLSKALINKALEESKESSIFEKFENLFGSLFGYWNEINREELLSYVRTLLDKDKSKAISLIESITPIGRSSVHPAPYKSDFSEGLYNWMENIFDTEYIYEVLQEAVGHEIDISDVVFTKLEEPNPSSENILKQFVYWHKKAIEEKESEKTSQNIEKTN